METGKWHVYRFTSASSWPSSYLLWYWLWHSFDGRHLPVHMSINGTTIRKLHKAQTRQTNKTLITFISSGALYPSSFTNSIARSPFCTKQLRPLKIASWPSRAGRACDTQEGRAELLTPSRKKVILVVTGWRTSKRLFETHPDRMRLKSMTACPAKHKGHILLIATSFPKRLNSSPMLHGGARFSHQELEAATRPGAWFLLEHCLFVLLCVSGTVLRTNS